MRFPMIGGSIYESCKTRYSDGPKKETVPYTPDV